MAVKIQITDAQIIAALNSPGGPVRRWADEVGALVTLQAQATAPVNSILNALHRGGAVGGFKAGFSWDRRGSNGHNAIVNITNSADHAVYAELGRSASSEKQVFTWEGWLPNVGPRRINHTRGRDGSHTLRNATNVVLARMTGGAYSPLV